MLSVEGLIFLGIKLAQLAAIALIPLAYGRLGDTALGVVRNADYPAIPLLIRASHVNGVLLGLGLLYFSPHAAHYTIADVFTDPGPWSLDFTRFLLERANPLVYSWPTLIEAANSEEAGLAPRIYLLICVGLLMMVAVLSFYFWPPSLPDRPRADGEAESEPGPTPRDWRWISAGLWPPADALRAIAVSYGATLWSTYLTIYLVNVLYWGMNLMNFWFLLAVAFVYQNYRYARHL